MDNGKLHVALVGLGFGGAFARIWKDHPQVGRVVLYDSDPALLQKVSQETGIPETADSFEAVLHDLSLDAVHLVTPIPLQRASMYTAPDVHLNGANWSTTHH